MSQDNAPAAPVDASAEAAPPPSSDASTDASSPSPRNTVGAAVGKAAGLLHPENLKLSNGERAELRRASLEQPVTPTLWKVLLEIKQGDAPRGVPPATWERRWATLLVGMGHCAGLHDYETPFGTALATAGWSERRFVRLMEADADALPPLIRRMSQYLASKQQPANWDDVRKLLFHVTGPYREDVRLRIARSYYSTLYQQTKDES